MLDVPKSGDAHLGAKHELIRYVNETGLVAMDENTFTIAVARRATAWKRADQESACFE